MGRTSQYHIKSAYMQARFKRVCKAMGWDCESETWTRNGNENVATVGRVFIERGPSARTYYRVVQMVNTGGGERHLSDNYSARELAAWFDGMLKAHETLISLHSDTALALDSLRGNEKFIAQCIRNSL